MTIYSYDQFTKGTKTSRPHYAASWGKERRERGRGEQNKREEEKGEEWLEGRIMMGGGKENKVMVVLVVDSDGGRKGEGREGGKERGCLRTWRVRGRECIEEWVG